MTGKDPYKILQVDAAASEVVIEAAYKALRKQKREGPEETRQWHAELQWAFNLLRGQASRHGYDRDKRWGRLRAMGPGDARAVGPVYLDTGPYAGWHVTDVAAHDPEYLVWLLRQRIAPEVRHAIDAVLGPQSPARR